MLCLEGPKEVFWAHYCCSNTLLSFFILENKLIGYADDITLMAAVPSQALELQ